jgi:hypothetical protein
MSEMLEHLMHLFVDEVTVRRKIGKDVDGYPKFEEDGTVYRARVSGKITNVLGEDGQVHTTSIRVTLPGPYGVTTQDQVEVPERFSRNPRETDPVKALKNRRYEPIAVERLTGRTGAHHEKLYI